MDVPKSESEVRRFLGMVNQLGKFSSNIANLTQPLRELLSTKKAWLWGTDQDRAFQQVKEKLSRPTVLAHYNPEADLKLSADASSYGLGAVLFQRELEFWKPVVYASRSMSETDVTTRKLKRKH